MLWYSSIEGAGAQWLSDGPEITQAEKEAGAHLSTHSRTGTHSPLLPEVGSAASTAVNLMFFKYGCLPSCGLPSPSSARLTDENPESQEIQACSEQKTPQSDPNATLSRLRICSLPATLVYQNDSHRSSTMSCQPPTHTPCPGKRLLAPTTAHWTEVGHLILL